MKPKSILGLAGGLVLAVGLWLTSHSSRADSNTQELMKTKLMHSQEILRAIALEDYQGIQTHAEKLSQLSQATGWFTRRTPEYELFTNELRRHADGLAKAGKAKNLDAASLAYFQLTVSCVSCHKYLRGSKVAALASPVTAGE